MVDASKVTIIVIEDSDWSSPPDSQESQESTSGPIATPSALVPDWSAMVLSPSPEAGRVVAISPAKPGVSAYPDWSCMNSSPDKNPVTPPRRSAKVALQPFRLSRPSPVRCKGPKPSSSSSSKCKGPKPSSSSSSKRKFEEQQQPARMIQGQRSVNVALQPFRLSRSSGFVGHKSS